MRFFREIISTVLFVSDATRSHLRSKLFGPDEPKSFIYLIEQLRTVDWSVSSARMS